MKSMATWHVRVRRRLPRSGRFAEACGEWRVPNNWRSRYPDWADLEQLLNWSRKLCGAAGGELRIERADVQLGWVWRVEGPAVVEEPIEKARARR